MKVYIVLCYNNIIKVCASKEKAFLSVKDSLQMFVNEEDITQISANEILKDLKEKGDSWLYHIEEWNVY